MLNKKVGVIGGGQLAWMMSDAAKKLGIELYIQTPSPQDPAVGIAKDVVLAKIDDAKATEKLASYCDVITFENEFIDLPALNVLAKKGVRFYPSLDSLSPLLDKYEQINYLQKIGIPVPRITTQESIEKIEKDFHFPLVVKARRNGYDGKGTWIVKNREALESLKKSLESLEIFIQEFISFDRELAVMAARNVAGEMIIYPLVETQQKHQVCHKVIAPADLSEAINLQIEAIARQILEKLNVVGIFGIELFLTSEGKVLVNEIAPRTHNSGHYTLDACLTSQFEQQLRAVTGLPLGSISLKSAGAVMVNLLGYENATSDYQNKRDRLAQIPQAYVRWYGKNESRPGRKLGHVTVLLDKQELTKAQAIASEVEKIWYDRL
jgi:5-(carboxyamino)imidazole ribonucleotide synthase